MRNSSDTSRRGLVAEDLSVGHGRDIVINGIRLDVPEGHLTCLLGPNGSGKSTLLAALARLLPARAGTVVLDGRNIAQQPTGDIARRLGFLPQQPLVPEGLTVFELVARGRFPHQGFLRHWSLKDEAAVIEAMELTQIRDLAERRVDALSGGQRQRVWIAMVLAQQTPLLLLDEPTTFLDVAHQIATLDLLRDLVKRHDRTIVCVLHDLNMALQYADRLVFLKDGAIRHVAEHPGACDASVVEDVFGVKSVPLLHPQTGLPVFLPCASHDAGSTA